MKPRSATLALVGAVLAAFLPVRAQVRPVYDTGAAGLVQLLERLPTTASAMHTGAHPDDEDSALIARLARGDHARVAYLSLNRGEGGQNALGPEQGDALGVVRTEELLQARRLDGGEQLFTRVVDFGYTESLPETVARWGETIPLGDMVRAIRLYRPLVVIARFTGTSADGHGNHQLSGYLTPIAFEQAADPAAFPEQVAEGLRPWAALKLYVREPSTPSPDNEAMLRLPTGVFDPVIGRTYFQVAIEGRSLHRTQEQGFLELGGPQSSGLRLAQTRLRTSAPDKGIFDGIDTTLAGIARLAGLPEGSLAGPLGQAQAAAVRALAALDVRSPARVLPDLAQGLRAVREARARLEAVPSSPANRAEAGFLLEIKEREFTQALVRAAGIQVEAVIDQETLTPGETANVTVRAFLGGDREQVTLGAPELRARAGLQVSPAPRPSPAPVVRRRLTETPDLEASFRATAPADAAPTLPYWLERPRSGYVFDWPADERRSLPFGPSLFEAAVPAELAGVPLVIRAPVLFRFADPVRGELRREPGVVPALSVDLGDDLLIVPTSKRPATRRLSVRLTAHTGSPLTGTVRLMVPAGWRTRPQDASFRLEGREQRTAVGFELEIPADAPPGAHPLSAAATVGSATFGDGVRVLAYPHILTHRILRRAAATARVLDLEVAPVRVGYVMGSGDLVPEAIVRMGLPLTLLDEDALSSGDLAAYDVIVAGIRAAPFRADFVSAHGRLLDWVRQGGTLVVQYQRADYAEKGLPPFPARMEERVTDEASPVTVLRPDDPIFNFPNRIGKEDWDGWVQERSVSNMNGMDDRWVALLEAHDEGDPPQKGLLIQAPVGRGLYVYAAVSFFRQLPAGVPGPYRLFANLLSRPKAPASPAALAAAQNVE